MKRSGRNPVSRLFHAKDDAGAIAAWKLDLNRILHVFNVCSPRSWLVAANYSQTELAMNTHTIVADMHQNMLRTREDTESRSPAVSGTRALSASPKGHSPSPRSGTGQLSRLPGDLMSYTRA